MSTPSPHRRFRLVITTLATICAGLAYTGIAAADASRLYAPCVVCHQPNAWGSPDGTIPSLAGQQERYLEKQLSLFRSGARMDATMQVVANHPMFNSAQTPALAIYLSSLAANPTPVVGPGQHLRVGQELFAHICAACHGADGRGNPANRVPKIAGQNYPYLSAQIDATAALHKELAPPEMASAMRGMPASQRDALADYISRLGTSEVLLESDDRAGMLHSSAERRTEAKSHELN